MLITEQLSWLEHLIGMMRVFSSLDQVTKVQSGRKWIMWMNIMNYY